MRHKRRRRNPSGTTPYLLLGAAAAAGYVYFVGEKGGLPPSLQYVYDGIRIGALDLKNKALPSGAPSGTL